MNAFDPNLKLDAEAVAPLRDEFEPVQLMTPHLLEAFWPLARPLLDRCVREAMHGEFEVDDLHRLALEGKVVIFVFTNDRTGTNPQREVALAFAAEPVMYPRLPAINILAMGGKGFDVLQKKYWDYVKGWAFMNGARAIEAWVSPAMQRVLSRWGYKPIYTHLRCDLTEMNND
jgi:hypothetical protein